MLLRASGEIDPPGVPANGEIQAALLQFEILEYISRDGMGVVYKVRQFEILRPWLDSGIAGDVSEAGIALDLSPTAVKAAIHRLRQRFRQMIRKEITATTADPEDTAAEFRHLVDIWVRVKNNPNKPPV